MQPIFYFRLYILHWQMLQKSLSKTKLLPSLRKKNRYAWKLHLLYTKEHAMSQEVSLGRPTKDAWVGPQSSSYEVRAYFILINSFKKGAEQH
jgi:hypothetical protein